MGNGGKAQLVGWLRLRAWPCHGILVALRLMCLEFTQEVASGLPADGR